MTEDHCRPVTGFVNRQIDGRLISSRRDLHRAAIRPAQIGHIKCASRLDSNLLLASLRSHFATVTFAAFAIMRGSAFFQAGFFGWH
jgi:hypothetical protein